jgi:pyridinium-3,5-bisthiocarboxylic acid mononucleotide nickel chelatase
MSRAKPRRAWFHCFSGIAGDMALGACLDAGADLEAVRTALAGLGLDGWSLAAEPVLRGGLAATHAVVEVDEGGPARDYAAIVALLDAAALSPRVRDRAHRVFRVLAEAEGKLHRRPPEEVHFHEVGSLDAIVDVVGTCAALEALGVDEIAASPVATGMGTVAAAHGRLPNPAPAVLELLRDAPVYGLDVDVELATPTGAALLVGLGADFGPLPALRIEATGRGAGTRELSHQPNVVQVVVGTVAESEADAGEPIVVLETNVDDVAGEVLAHALACMLDAGALDAWATPVTMKKGRPGVLLTVLSEVADAPRLRDLLAEETGTFGVRGRSVQRWCDPRVFDEVDVDGERIRVKGTPRRVKAEFGDAAAAAAATGRPVREVIARAEAEARRRRLGGAPPD